MNKTAAFVALLYALPAQAGFAMGDNIGYTLLEKVTFVSGFPPATFHPAE